MQSQSGVIQELGRILSKQPIAYKLIDAACNIGIARTIRAQSPKTKIILRPLADNWALDRDWTNGFVERNMRLAEPFLQEGLCDFLEPPNEPVIFNADAAKLLNELQVNVAHAYKQHGYQCVAYQFSVGNPDYALWPYLIDGLVECADDAGYFWLGLHQYGAPRLDSNAADLSLRHRKVLPLLSPAIRSRTRIIISECWIDFGIGRNPPDGLPTAGGYRKVPKQGDSDDFWIDEMLRQATWWDSELAKDEAIACALMYGYAMQEPWVGLGFDPQNFDNDRNKFINWITTGEFMSNSPALLSPTAAEIRNAGWNSIGRGLNERGVDFNPDAALYKAAAALAPDAYPVGQEFRFHTPTWVGQGYSTFIVACQDNDFGNIKPYKWSTGELWTPPSPNPTPLPPPSSTRLTEFPTSYSPLKFKADWFVAVAGKPFYGLVAVTDPPVIDIGARFVFQVGDANGQPQGGVSCYHLFGDKFECFKTDGFGLAAFNLGRGSGYSVSESPRDKFYVGVAYVDKDSGQPPAAPIGDVYYYGLPNGHHIDCTYSVRQMIG